ncbi:MAG: threonine/serine exporter family protein [Eubacteriales bacterium]
MTVTELLNLLRIFGLCAAATLCYALLMRIPLRALILSAFLGSAGYIIFIISSNYLTSILAAYFIGTLFVSVIGEIMARIMKMPSTIFVIPSIIPLVPGYGLYLTMLLLVQNDFNGFIKTGAQTLFIAGIMAAAIALTNFVARRLIPPGKVEKKQF